MGSKNVDIKQTLPSPNTPKTFKFDKNTDLKKELENINPRLLDSDFD